MTVDVKKIGGAVLELERSLNERWSTGDCHGYLGNYHDDISYFDPVVERILIGRESVVEHLLKLYKNPHIVRSEYLNPHVIVSNGGDLAVLSYNLNTFVSDEGGATSFTGLGIRRRFIVSSMANGASCIRTGRSRSPPLLLQHHKK